MSAKIDGVYSRSIEIKSTDNLNAFERKLYVVDQIGRLNIPAFERWAFHYEQGMIYDTRVPFMWSCAHSKAPVSDDVDEALNSIIKLWKCTYEPEWPGIIYGD
jgi:hypothetical protein